MSKDAEKQKKTIESFGFEWKSCPVTSDVRNVYIKRFLARYDYKLDDFREQIDGKKVLDAGCGMAWRTDWFGKLNPSGIVVGIDLAREAVETGKRLLGANVVIADLGKPPFPKDFFDYIACEGVIHHTPDPEGYLSRLVEVLKTDGLMTLYIYKKKPLLRELTDTAIRRKTTKMSAKECLDFSKKMTELGEELFKIDKMIEVPEISLLGIRGGTYRVQSFIYEYFLKCYWDWETQDYMQSLFTNFDWYHPEHAYRFSRSEVENLLTSSGLKIECIKEQMSGFAIKARKGSID